MPRFVTERDFQFFQHINKEIVMDIVDVPVVLYRIVPELTSINIYGESTNKARYRGIQLHALVQYSGTEPVSEGFGFDASQTAEFRFVRKLLQDTNTYPEVGDVIGYNESFYEINSINEIQLIAGRPQYTHSIVCSTHLTRRSSINIEETHI